MPTMNDIKPLTLRAAIKTASLLKSESRENPEYDRALVEFLSYGYGITQAEAVDALGLLWADLYPGTKRG